MAASKDMGSEFVTAFTLLSRDPDSYTAQQRVLANLNDLKTQAAQGNAMAFYRLAMAFPPKSDKYCELMGQAAKLGSTNAMFSLMQMYSKTNPKLSAKYARGILSSQDTYLREQTSAYLEDHPELKQRVTPNPHQFFAAAEGQEKPGKKPDLSPR